MKAELFLRTDCVLAEGPVWHGDHLWWVDIPAGNLHRCAPDGGVYQTRSFGAPLGCAVPASDGRWIGACPARLSWLDWESGRTGLFLELEGEQPGNRFNDGKCDPRGRLWVGSMAMDGAPGQGSLYRVEMTGAIPRAARTLPGLGIANGLGWAPDGARFFYIDSPTRRIDVFDFDMESGGLSNRRVFVDLSHIEGVPDGMSVDADGHLWVAFWGGATLRRFEGRTGREIVSVQMPVSQPSSCCFGPDGLLFITSARDGLTPERLVQEPEAGSLFCVQTDACAGEARTLEVGPSAQF